MSATRQKLQEALCSYTSDTLAYFDTVRGFCERSSRWMLGRETELNLIKDIEERADKINLKFKHVVESKNKGTAFAEYLKNRMKAKSKREELVKELASELKKTLGGLEELSCFLDALEKLAVTSLHVFMENQVLHRLKGINLDDVQVVIIVARQVCPLLLEFKRDANVFFLPKLQNVGVLSYHLDKYIQTTQIIIDMLKKSSFSEFYPRMKTKKVVEFNVDWSEGDVQRMFSHIDQLNKIRKDQDFQMVFLFQEEKKCYDFMRKFREHKPRMLQFLEELEDSCLQLDRMNKGSKISSVAGSSVGVVGGVLSIVGLALAPVTAGVSLGLTIGGTVMGVTSAVNSAVTTATEAGVNCKYQEKASEVFKNFMDDVQVIQDCLEEVSRRETISIVVTSRECPLLFRAGGIGKGIYDIVEDVFALMVLENKNLIANAGKVVAQNGQALGNVSRVASNVPGIGQATLKGSRALCKAARGFSFAASALFIGMDIYTICNDSSSLAKGSETEVSQFIRARAALWCSEIKSWQKISDSLRKGLLASKKNKSILERSFYL